MLQRIELESALTACISENQESAKDLHDLQAKLNQIKDTTKQEKQSFIIACEVCDAEIRWGCHRPRSIMFMQ
jgi:hypothetical protein